MKTRNKLFLKDFIFSIVIFIILWIFRGYWRNIQAYVLQQTHNDFYAVYSHIVCNLIVVVSLLLYIVQWLGFVRHTIMHKKICRSLVIMTFIMIFWFLIRSIKYYYFSGNDILNRYFWYLFYFGMLFIPLFAFKASLYIGHDEKWNVSIKYYAVVGITILLFLMVMTNEYHHLVFTFSTEQYLLTGDYSYGPLYYLVAGWMIVLTGAMLSIIYYKSHILSSRKRLWMPLCIVLFLILYSSVYNYLKIYFIEVTIIYIWFYILYMKSIIYSGLIPSNFLHTSIFDESSISTMILDDKNNVKYTSKNTSQISNQIMNQLNHKSFSLDERTAIKQSFIHGGSIVWLEDTSSINIVISRLKNLQNEIKESNELLQAEIKLKEKDEKVRIQSKLYDSIVLELKDSINQLDSLLQEENPDLFLICLLGSYIKRKSNLIILEQNQESVKAEELDYCMKEILDVLKTKNISCIFINTQQEKMPISVLKDLYDSFIEIILLTYPSIKSLMVKCFYEQQFGIKVIVDTDENVKINDIKYDVEQEDSTLYITYIKKEEI